MKHLLLSFTAAIFCSAAIAQISLEEHDPTTIVGGYEDSQIAYHVTVLNTTSNPIDVNAERTVISDVAGSRNQFCWGPTCYPYAVDKSSTFETIPASGKNETFIAYYEPRYNPGTAVIKYRFSLANNEFVNTSIEVTYDATQPTSIGERLNTVRLFQAQPSATNGLTTFKYAVNDISDTQFELRNLTGQLVKTSKITALDGAIIFDASTLPKGIYIYSLRMGAKVESSNKLVVY